MTSPFFPWPTTILRISHLSSTRMNISTGATAGVTCLHPMNHFPHKMACDLLNSFHRWPTTTQVLPTLARFLPARLVRDPAPATRCTGSVPRQPGSPVTMEQLTGVKHATSLLQHISGTTLLRLKLWLLLSTSAFRPVPTSKVVTLQRSTSTISSTR